MRQVTIEVLGVHSILNAREPCSMIELRASGFVPPFDTDIVQPEPNRPSRYWQAAYDFRRLNEFGTEVIRWGESWPPVSRLCFFLHYTNMQVPLVSVYGEIRLPPATPLPPRLALAHPYDPPD